MLVLMRKANSGDKVLINMSRIVRVTQLTEGKTCIMWLTDGAKVAVSHSLEDICNKLAVYIDFGEDDKCSVSDSSSDS